MPYHEWRKPDDPESEAQNNGEEAQLETFKLYETSRKSILDALGSWKLDSPLQNVQKLRDQYRKKLMIDDLEQKD